MIVPLTSTPRRYGGPPPAHPPGSQQLTTRSEYLLLSVKHTHTVACNLGLSKFHFFDQGIAMDNFVHICSAAVYIYSHFMKTMYTISCFFLCSSGLFSLSRQSLRLNPRSQLPSHCPKLQPLSQCPRAPRSQRLLNKLTQYSTYR